MCVCVCVLTKVRGRHVLDRSLVMYQIQAALEAILAAFMSDDQGRGGRKGGRERDRRERGQETEK